MPTFPITTSLQIDESNIRQFFVRCFFLNMLALPQIITIRYVYGNELLAVSEMKYCRTLSECYYPLQHRHMFPFSGVIISEVGMCVSKRWDLQHHDKTTCFLYEILHDFYMG